MLATFSARTAPERTAALFWLTQNKLRAETKAVIFLYMLQDLPLDL